MKTSILINNSSITNNLECVDTITEYLNCLGVSIAKIVLTSNFSDDYEKLVYDASNDFLIVIGGNSNVKGNIKVFNLPANLDDIKEHLNNIGSFVNSITKSNKNRVVIRTFGLTEKQIKAKLQELLDNDNIILSTIANDLDVKLIVEYDNDLEYNTRQDIISTIYENLRAYIYTDDNMTLYELACNLLAVNHKTCSVVETITAGNIIKNLNAVDGDHTILNGIVSASVDGLIDILKLSTEQLQDNNGVEIVYEMAAGMLELSHSDYAIATYGDNNDKYFYIAVGDSEGIHVYKSSCSAKGNKLIDTLSKNTIFHLIKKIKQNDLFFNQFVV